MKNTLSLLKCKVLTSFHRKCCLGSSGYTVVKTLKPHTWCNRHFDRWFLRRVETYIDDEKGGSSPQIKGRGT